MRTAGTPPGADRALGDHHRIAGAIVLSDIAHQGAQVVLDREGQVCQTLEAAQDADLDTSRSKGLINYLMRDRHGSPFEHSSMTFFVQAPIFMWREHFRHRIASYNEESGRYRELRPVFYVPGPDRRLVQIGKAGAGPIQVSFIRMLSRTTAPGEMYTPGDSTDRTTSPRTMQPLQIILWCAPACGPSFAGARPSLLVWMTQLGS